MSSCASHAPPSAPPQLTLSADVRRPCALATSDYATAGDLGATNMARGAAVAECEGKRADAVFAFDEQARLAQEWLRQRAERARPWWKLW